MLLLKFIVVPALIGLADIMMADVFFSSVWAMVWTGLTLAAIGLLMESFMLRRGSLWLMTAADGATAALGLYVAQFVFDGSYVSWVGALLAGGLIAIPEYFAHRAAINRAGEARA